MPPASSTTSTTTSRYYVGPFPEVDVLLPGRTLPVRLARGEAIEDLTQEETVLLDASGDYHQAPDGEPQKPAEIPADHLAPAAPDEAAPAGENVTAAPLAPTPPPAPVPTSPPNPTGPAAPPDPAQAAPSADSTPKE